MTEQDKTLIQKLWVSRQPISCIIRMLPYPENEARKMVKALREDGTLTDEVRKKDGTAEIMKLYHSGVTSPYEIAEKSGYALNTVNDVLQRQKLGRKRPPHNYRKRMPTDITTLNAKTQEIVTALKHGEVSSIIAKKYNVSRQYVSKIKKKYVVKQS